MQAKLQDFHIHDLSLTFANRLVQSGVDLYRFSKMMGHCAIKMTERYLHHSQARPHLNLAALE